MYFITHKFVARSTYSKFGNYSLREKGGNNKFNGFNGFDSEVPNHFEDIVLYFYQLIEWSLVNFNVLLVETLFKGFLLFYFFFNIHHSFSFKSFSLPLLVFVVFFLFTEFLFLIEEPLELFLILLL